MIRLVNFVCEVALLKIERGLGLRDEVIILQKMLYIDPIACLSSFSCSLLGWMMIQKDICLGKSELLLRFPVPHSIFQRKAMVGQVFPVSISH